jgi:hypothetical protein
MLAGLEMAWIVDGHKVGALAFVVGISFYILGAFVAEIVFGVIIFTCGKFVVKIPRGDV